MLKQEPNPTQGDASVPTHHPNSPRPYEIKNPDLSFWWNLIVHRTTFLPVYEGSSVLNVLIPSFVSSPARDWYSCFEP